MNDARARRHPLAVAIQNAAPVAQAIAVFQIAFDQVSYCLNAAMRVPGESADVILGVGGIEGVHQQEGIEILGFIVPEQAHQVYAGAVNGVSSVNDFFDFPQSVVHN